MNTIFPHAPAETLTGSLAYLQAVQRAFPEEQLSGLIEITLAPAEHIYILYADGTCVATFHQTAQSLTEIATANLRGLWPAGDTDLRILHLPRQAIFAVRMLMDWQPPTQKVVLQSSALQNWIAHLGEEKISGLVSIEWPDEECMLPILDGISLAGESVFVTRDGAQVGNAAHRLIFNQPARAITLTLYEARPDTISYRMLALRQAVHDLSRGILSRYSQLVGRGLTSALAGDLNHIMQMNGVQIQIVGEILNNTHIFRSLEEASETYQLLFKALYEHTANVLGPGLARTIINDTLTGINQYNQNTMQEYTVLSGVALR